MKSGNMWMSEVRYCHLVAVAFTLLAVADIVSGACIEPCLYYTNSTALKRLQLQASTGKASAGTPVETIYSKGKIIGPIALDHAGGRIFWADAGDRRIYKAYVNGSMPQPLIKHGIGLCEGIAYDWSTGNIYWTDSLHDWIEVASADGKNRKVLINGTMGQPRGIVVTPFDGYIFWTDFGSKARIERASLDGKNRRSIVTSRLVWPNDLAIDFVAKRIYWIDAYRDEIASTDYSGAGRMLHADVTYYGTYRMHPYSMALFFQHSLAYFTDWYRSVVLYTPLNSVTARPQYAVKTPHRVKRIGQVKILHSSIQPPASSPCLTNRTSCSHLCLKNSSTGYVCACPTGMKLALPGGSHCEKAELDYQAFLLDGSFKNSKMFHISKFTGQSQHVFDTLNLSTSGLPVGLDFDPKSQMLYWSDVKLDKILKMYVNGSGFQVVLGKMLQTPEGVALDPVSKLLYFADHGRQTIEVVKLDGTARKVLINGSLVHPRDIQLYHEKGLMFFSDWGKQNPKIESAFLDGTGRKVVISSSVSAPSGLAVDRIERRLFWCDMRFDRIESADFDGSNRRILFDHFGYNPYVAIDTITGEVQTPYGLALFGDKVFWTDWATKSVYTADKRTGGKINLVSTGFERPMQISVYSSKPQKEFKKIYHFSHARSSSSLNHSCFADSCSLNVTEEPAMCPPGFKQTKYGQICAKCNTNFGLGSRRCPCKDWMTCAHRSYLKSSCPNRRPLMSFKVRECVQVVQPGFCPTPICYHFMKNESNCISDGDCLYNLKCCYTLCGRKCLSSIKEPAQHPCQISNGGCSHFCFRMPKSFKCGCPDGMVLPNANDKKCIFAAGYCARNKPCLNGGVCNDVGTNSYTCACQQGYRGKHCQSCDKCLNGALCVSNSTSIQCNCTTGYHGDRCQTVNQQCTASSCKNNGTCALRNNQARCNCPASFTGKKCETAIACEPNPCANNGTCVLFGESGAKCLCPPDFTGQHCDTPMACNPNPCQNDGKCSMSDGLTRCACKPQNTGKRCETWLACSPNPCQNNGTCSMSNGLTRCACKSQNTGKRCETWLTATTTATTARNYCDGHSCKNRAVCVNSQTGYTCNCRPDYTGMYCDRKIDDCAGIDCKNAGTCIDEINGYRCVCEGIYTGLHCESAVDQCQGSYCMNGGTCIAQKLKGLGKLLHTCKCAQNFTGYTCRVFYGDGLVRVYFAGRSTDMPSQSKIQVLLAAEYTAYCAAQDCTGTNVVTRKKRETKSSVVVSKDDIVIPDGFPRASGKAEIELQYAVVANKDGNFFVLSSKVARAGFLASKAKIELGLGLKYTSIQAIGSKPTPKPPGELGGRENSSGKWIPALVIVIVIFGLIVVLVLFYWKRKQRQNFQRSKFSETSFDNIIYQSSTALTTAETPNVEIRRRGEQEKGSQEFQFQNMMYANNDMYGQGLKVDLSRSGHSVEIESKDGVTGVTNPYAELPEEEKRAHYVTRTNSTTIVTGKLPSLGLTSLDPDQGIIDTKQTPRSPRLVDESELKGTVVRVQSSDLAGFAPPHAGQEADIYSEVGEALVSPTSEADPVLVDQESDFLAPSWLAENERKLDVIETLTRNDDSFA